MKRSNSSNRSNHSPLSPRRGGQGGERLLLFLLLALTPLLATAQTTVTPYRPGLTAEGITYFLPTTNLRIVVTATRTTHTPGEYAPYAERFLHLTDVPQTTYDTWTLDDVKVHSYGTADTDQAYTIKLKAKTSAPYVSLTSDFRLLSVNAAGTAAAEADEALPMPSVTKIATPTVNPSDYKTEEILAAGSTAKMAELTAAEIYDIRENRSLLAKGQADFMPKDGEQLRLMLASLDEQETALLQLFRGTTARTRHVYTFDITPAGEITQQPILSFSRLLGIVDADDPAGTPLYISLVDLHTLPAPVRQPDGKAKKEAEDLRYIVPGTARVTLFTPERTLLTQTLPFAQLGRVEHLGGELFNKKTSTHVRLSPVTGGILHIEAAQPE